MSNETKRPKCLVRLSRWRVIAGGALALLVSAPSCDRSTSTVTANEAALMKSPPGGSIAQDREVMAAIQRLRRDLCPVGSIVAFAGPIDRRQANLLEESGWLVCDGRERPRRDFPELADVIENTWRKAADRDKFVVPDLRGQFLRGVNESAKDEDGNFVDGDGDKRTVGSPQHDEIRDHNHVINGLAWCYMFPAIPPQPPAAGVPPVGGFVGTGPGVDPAAPASPFGFVYATTMVSLGGGGAHSYTSAQAKETRPKNIAVYWIIRGT